MILARDTEIITEGPCFKWIGDRKRDPQGALFAEYKASAIVGVIRAARRACVELASEPPNPALDQLLLALDRLDVPERLFK